MVKKKKCYSSVDKTADSLSPSQVCDILWTASMFIICFL